MRLTGIIIAFILATFGAAAAAMKGAQHATQHASAVAAPSEDPAIDRQIRAYILNHPEIIPEAIKRLEQRQVQATLVSAGPELTTPSFPGAVGGNPNGDVTLVVFFDYRCPYCHQAKTEEDALVNSDPNLRIVYRHFPALDQPGHEPISRHAGLLALAAAKQGKHKAFHDALFETSGPITEQTLVAAARTAGLDERRAMADVATTALSDAIERNIELARVLGVTGTPTYVLGDHIISGAGRFNEFRAWIAEIRKSRATSASR